jgi:hypothetical protein
LFTLLCPFPLANIFRLAAQNIRGNLLIGVFLYFVASLEKASPRGMAVRILFVFICNLADWKVDNSNFLASSASNFSYCFHNIPGSVEQKLSTVDAAKRDSLGVLIKRPVHIVKNPYFF